MMKMNTPRRATAVALCSALIAVGTMQALQAAPEKASGPVAINLTAYKVVAHGEKEELQSADRIKPGEIIEYQARYVNTSQRGVQNLSATLPIPAALEVLPATAFPQGAQVSTDGKTFAPAPLKRITKNPDGSTKVELVPAAEYRFLRWTVGELGAGKSAQVSARARVLGPANNSASNATATSNAAAGKGGGR